MLRSVLISVVVLAVGGSFTTAVAGAPAIVNGTFDTDASGWELSPQSTWRDDEPDCDGGTGMCQVNGPLAALPWIQQNITGLTPSESYRITMCYKTKTEWFDGPSFQVKIDGEVKITGGSTAINDWNVEDINFTFVAADTDALLRIETQIGSDSDYVVDNIVLTQATIPTVSEWGMAALVLLVMVAGTVVFKRLRLAT